MTRTPRPGDMFGLAMFGRDPQKCWEQSICVCCGESATEFADELSAREYRLSVFCQDCQDKTF